MSEHTRDPMEGTPLLPLGNGALARIWDRAGCMDTCIDYTERLICACVELGIQPKRTQYQSRYHAKRIYT